MKLHCIRVRVRVRVRVLHSTFRYCIQTPPLRPSVRVQFSLSLSLFLDPCLSSLLLPNGTEHQIGLEQFIPFLSMEEQDEDECDISFAR